MNQITQAMRRLTKKGERNILKITSLTIGLSVALVLCSKVLFDTSYDTFWPHANRTYRMQFTYTQFSDGTSGEMTRISGAPAFYAGQEIPQVEAATRFTPMGSGLFTTEDKRELRASYQLADSAFFDVFECRILEGNAQQVLATENMVMITDRLARALGGNPVGQTIVINNHRDVRLTIGGVYEAIAPNSHLEMDMLISLPTIGNFIWDGSLNWLGNDRYFGYLRLRPEDKKADVISEMTAVMSRYIDQEHLREAGLDIAPVLNPITKIHLQDTMVSILVSMLGAIALIVLLIALFNYVLVSISGMNERARELALHRCYGASTRNINCLTLAEGGLHIKLAVGLSAILIFAMRTPIEALMEVGYADLFSCRTLVGLGVVCVVMWLGCSLLPTILYGRVPVSVVFRMVHTNKHKWKMALLFLQFAISSFLIMFLWLAVQQYSAMADEGVGYTYDRTVVADLRPIAESSDRQVVLDEMRQMHEVTDVTGAHRVLFNGASGNNVYEGEQEIFNIADNYYVTDNYFNFMDIEVTQGGIIDPEVAGVMVSERFVEHMRMHQLWDETQGVGETIHITEHGQCRVLGIYKDVRIGNAVYNDARPSAFFYEPDYVPTLLMMRLNQVTPETLAALSEQLRTLVPDVSIELYSYGERLEATYSEWLRFRNTMGIAALIALAIAVLGLVGFITNEVERRSKEMAIRKINGCTYRDILNIYLRHISIIATSAFSLGIVAANAASSAWQNTFAIKASASWLSAIAVFAGLYAIVVSVVAYNSYKAHKENPTDFLQ